MSSKILLAGTFIVFVAVIGVAYLTLPHNSNIQTPAVTDATADTGSSVPASTSTPPTGGTSADTSTSQYTLAKVATHKSAASCWAAINGNVYDLTKWINQHPGGPEHILAICGTDASAVFNQQHGGEARPASELKNFLLGPLSQ
jgi:cytochrome b involved in lipid metabolism